MDKKYYVVLPGDRLLLVSKQKVLFIKDYYDLEGIPYVYSAKEGYLVPIDKISAILTQSHIKKI